MLGGPLQLYLFYLVLLKICYSTYILELSNVSKRLIALMYKKEKIDEAKAVSKAMKEDWLKNKNNQMEEFLIDIRAAAKDDLSKAKVAAEKKRKF